MVNIKSMIFFEEGVKHDAYYDPKHLLTIGVGHLVTNNDAERKITMKQIVFGSTISTDQIIKLYEYDMATTLNGLNERIVGYPTFKPAFKSVLISMGYNMGVPRLTKFVNMLRAMRCDDDEGVIRELKDSDYYKQLPERVNRLIDVIEGRIPPEYQ